MVKAGTTIWTRASKVALICGIMTCTAGCNGAKDEKVTPERLARGGKLFAAHCAGCHPEGENRLYPQKSLHRMELRANGIVDAADVVDMMRNPGEGMKRFDRKTLPDDDARAIAYYVLATF